MLARSLVEKERYDQEAARQAYVHWLESDPFDCGVTIDAGLTGLPDRESQANGALMRISPLGIFGARYGLEEVMEWARQDAAITHPREVCGQANALFAASLSFAIASGADAAGVYDELCSLADCIAVESSLREAIAGAAHSPPSECVHQQGWVLIAFRNALWQLLHAETLEDGVVDTVMRGGDTDTNAAICGALLGAVHGVDAVPDQWRQAVLGCRPEAGNRACANRAPRSSGPWTRWNSRCDSSAWTRLDPHRPEARATARRGTNSVPRNGCRRRVAGRQGFEPRFYGPEPHVLPLDDLPAVAASRAV